MLGRRPVPSYRRMTRRDFLRRSAGAAVALPSAAAILAACARPGRLPPGTQLVPLARQDSPVLLPTYEDPISTGTPIEEGATLKVYNWDAYMKKGVLIAFEEKFGVKVEWTTFNNMSEAIVKIATGQVVPDVFFPTVDYLARLVESKLLQPLNHDLIPNLPANMWKQFQDPFYDQQWRYTVPYTIYTTGIAYRRDHVDDAEVSQKGYDMLWDSKYRGKVGIYDDYREAIGMALLRRGSKEINTGDGALIVRAKDDIIDLMRATDARITINGAYAKIPEDEFWVHQSWSGDIVGAQYYLPKGVSTDVLGYWYPPEKDGAIGNDLIVIPAGAEHPRLAHEFLNFFLDEHWGFVNFAKWNGYQPPMKSIKPDTLIADGWVPPTLPAAVLDAQNFDTGKFALELSPEDDQLWLDAWDEILAGA
ncbi:MAG: polyamine ABC transporter substrate-binding protein [Actinomycetota bacterium]